ncbi:glucosidase II beta subunit-like protein-domain-containing protein [Bisporella sp. PMI_857]|nr:glucosidase II beta subunit-like protein-domain-containing protein [Bisporella sp. PMI_857]
MRRPIGALLATASIALASQNVFSVHDDLLAFPQYEVVFSEDVISDVEARYIIASAISTTQTRESSITKNVDSRNPQIPHGNDNSDGSFWDPAHQKYEMMTSKGEDYLCTIPIVETPVKNETSEAEARAAEQKELARATDRGWELLQDLEGNCLYFVSGWWSYSFCYNSEIVQFHQITPQPGKAISPPQPDPDMKQYVLGKVKTTKRNKEDERGNQIEAKKGQKRSEPPKTELQVKGDTRYLVQKMEGGTTCDLTGKPRRIEVQYHCNPHVNDRIGYIKEVTTCSYLMVVYTPRLCNDVAFQPPKETKANKIVCRIVVSEDEIAYHKSLKTLESNLEATANKIEKPINIGGVIVGAGKWANKEGARMPVPQNFGQEDQGRKTTIIASAKSKAEGGKVEVVSDIDLQKMDVKPELVEELKAEVQRLAKDRGWKIEVVDAPGAVREILGSVVDDDEKEAESEEGSEEIFKDEL